MASGKFHPLLLDLHFLNLQETAAICDTDANASQKYNIWFYFVLRHEQVRERCRQEWFVFERRMNNAEKTYFKSIGIDPAKFRKP